MSNVVQHCCRVLLLLSIAGTEAAQVPANVREAGTTSLLLLYKCKPENRPGFRSYLQRKELPRLRAMQKAGSLAEEHILFSRYVDTENWDALIFLQFSSPQAASAWSAVEAATPAGLDAEG